MEKLENQKTSKWKNYICIIILGLILEIFFIGILNIFEIIGKKDNSDVALPGIEIFKVYRDYNQKYDKNTIPDELVIKNYFSGTLKTSDITNKGYTLTYTNIPTGKSCTELLYYRKNHFSEVNGISYKDKSLKNKLRAICNTTNKTIDATFKFNR